MDYIFFTRNNCQYKVWSLLKCLFRTFNTNLEDKTSTEYAELGSKMKTGLEKSLCDDGDSTCSITIDKFSENTIHSNFDTNVHYTLTHIISFTSLDDLGTKRTSLQNKIKCKDISIDGFTIGPCTKTFSKINSIRGHSLTTLTNFWFI